jgi:hypothetical protein
MNTHLYLSDVLAARRAEADREAARWAKQDAKAAKFQIAQNLHPAIGALMSANGVRYYAFISGTYTEGSVDQLTAALAA